MVVAGAKLIKTDYDIAIIGAGFGGSLMAMIARRLGYSVLLIEGGKHPRFAIGESTSPLTNLVLEQIATRYDLPRLLPLCQWGTWQETYPHLAAGLKRGFTYYRQEAGKSYSDTSNREHQLLVAASPNDRLADTHWYRADVDAFLAGEATACGADYMDETRLTQANLLPDGAGMRLTGTRHHTPVSITARLVLDASGARGFLWKALGLGEDAFPNYPQTHTLFSHFTDVARTDTMPDYQNAPGETPPYPPDNAALHHVFDGGWMWVLRFNNGVTSAGCAVESWLAKELRLDEGNEKAWARFLARFPTVQEQFVHAKSVEPFRYGSRLSWRVASAADMTGPGWALLPSAGAFVDPLYSTGFPLMLLGIERLAEVLKNGLDAPNLEAQFDHYAHATLADAEHTARFIAGNYRAFGQFSSAFISLSQFYFAAASYSEMARRLEKPHLLRGYLAPDSLAFMEDITHAAEAAPHVFLADVCAAVNPVNIAGLCDPGKRNWYPVNLADLINTASKLGETPETMRNILAHASWAG